MTKIISNNFKTLQYIADTQLDAVLEKQSAKRYTLRKSKSMMPYISFETLREVSYFLLSPNKFQEGRMTDVVFYRVIKKASNNWEAFANGKKMVEDMPIFKTKQEAVAFLQRYFIRYEIENTLLLNWNRRG